ncbi:ABC transporter permease [Streptomyces sp. NPDC056835]|uniref:ABC transporter permease n=1 Tax=Streptomyces sp. NPDC056835 TaxID=3345956 RepID=UPI0036966383
MRTELRQAVVVMVVVAVSGLALGLLWLWLSPRIPLISDETAVFLKDTEGEEAIAGDGTFLLLALAFGVVSAALVFVFRRRGGIPLVVGLALGGLLGAVLAWRIGVWFGPTSDVVAHARAVGKGVTFDAPLELNAKGALLAWPIAAMVVHLALTALFGPRDPEPRWEDWGPVAYGPAPAPDAAVGPAPAPDAAVGPAPAPDAAVGPAPAPDNAAGPAPAPGDAAPR